MVFPITQNLEELGYRFPAWHPRGWAAEVNDLLSPPGKTMLVRGDWKINLTREQYAQLSQRAHEVVALSGLRWHPATVPWGAFRGETPTGDFEADRERVMEWSESYDP